MFQLQNSQIKQFTSFGGKTGALNWVDTCTLKDGTRKKVKRDALGTYIVIDRKRHYFPATSFVNKSTLFSEMKDSYNFFASMR